MSDSPFSGKHVVMVGAIVVVDVAIEAELRLAGAQTVAAYPSPLEGIAACVRDKPDLLLMGITPTNLSEFVNVLPEVMKDPDLIAAAVVHNLDIDGERRLRDARVTSIFRRPFRTKDLIAALEEIHRQRFSRNAIRSPEPTRDSSVIRIVRDR